MLCTMKNIGRYYNLVSVKIRLQMFANLDVIIEYYCKQYMITRVGIVSIRSVEITKSNLQICQFLI